MTRAWDLAPVWVSWPRRLRTWFITSMIKFHVLLIKQFSPFKTENTVWVPLKDLSHHGFFFYSTHTSVFCWTGGFWQRSQVYRHTMCPTPCDGLRRHHRRTMAPGSQRSCRLAGVANEDQECKKMQNDGCSGAVGVEESREAEGPRMSGLGRGRPLLVDFPHPLPLPGHRHLKGSKMRRRRIRSMSRLPGVS